LYNGSDVYESRLCSCRTLVPNHIPRGFCKYISKYISTMFHWSVFSLLLQIYSSAQSPNLDLCLLFTQFVSWVLITVLRHGMYLTTKLEPVLIKDRGGRSANITWTNQQICGLTQFVKFPDLPQMWHWGFAICGSKIVVMCGLKTCKSANTYDIFSLYKYSI
jgi:hypothetical protein